MKKFWKVLLSNLGLAILVGGVGYLVYLVQTGVQTNLTLGIALSVMVGGFVSHILLNKLV